LLNYVSDTMKCCTDDSELFDVKCLLEQLASTDVSKPLDHIDIGIPASGLVRLFVLLIYFLLYTLTKLGHSQEIRYREFFGLSPTGASKGTPGDAKCVTEILRGTKIRKLGWTKCTFFVSKDVYI